MIYIELNSLFKKLKIVNGKLEDRRHLTENGKQKTDNLLKTSPIADIKFYLKKLFYVSYKYHTF